MGRFEVPNPGEGWRVVEVGETIPNDAEVWGGGHARHRCWYPSRFWVGTPYTQGDRDQGWFYRTREGVKAVKAEPNWAAKTIRKAWEIFKKGMGK